jgi:hypothetical protein
MILFFFGEEFYLESSRITIFFEMKISKLILILWQMCQSCQYYYTIIIMFFLVAVLLATLTAQV